MCSQQNIKFVNAQQTKHIYCYKNIKKKLYKTNAAIWYDETCIHKQLTPNCISIKVSGDNPQRQKMSSVLILPTASEHKCMTYINCCIYR